MYGLNNCMAKDKNCCVNLSANCFKTENAKFPCIAIFHLLQRKVDFAFLSQCNAHVL